MRKIALALFAILYLSSHTGAANAAHRHDSVRHHHQHISHNSGGRPSEWCGWQMRQWNGGGDEYNLASNWAHRGTPTIPRIGAIVVWRHHVAQIDGYDAKKHMWTVRQGNPYREHHPRSLAGAIAYRAL